MEGSDHPEWALESAEKLGKLAPSSGHVVHMPGHIFYRVGDYERAREIFLEAARVDRDYMDKQHVSIRDDWNYAHNLSYLIADCAEAGRYKEALQHASELQGTADDPDQSTNPGFYILQVGSSAARLAIRFGAWDDAIETAHQLWRSRRQAQRCRARVSRRTGRLRAGDEGCRIGTIWPRQTGNPLSSMHRCGACRRRKSRIRPRAFAIGWSRFWRRRRSIFAEISRATGAISKMMQLLLDQAADHERELGYSEPPTYARPESEALGYALIRAGKYSDAREAFSKELHERPHSGFALYGIALAWDREGNSAEAAKAYREFLDTWKNADRDLPQIRAAESRLTSGR